MKKVIAFILCIFMLCGLVACSKSDTSSEFSSYYVIVETNTDKDTFDESDNGVLSDNVSKTENEAENDNVSQNNESTNITENNSSVINDNTSNGSINNKEVVSNVTYQQPVTETPNVPDTPQYQTLKLHEKVTHNGLVGIFILDSEIETFDFTIIEGMSRQNTGFIESEYYVFDSKESIYFAFISDNLTGSDTEFEAFYENMRTIPVIIEK